LARETVIEGAVVLDRAPVPNATVDLLPLTGEDASDFIAEGRRTDARGDFKFEHAGARAYLLYVRSKVGVSPPIPIDASDGAPHRVDVRLTGGAPITIRLDEALQEANRHGSEYTIRIVDERKFPILDSSLPNSGSTRLALAPGSYSLLTRYRNVAIVEQLFD